MQQLERETVALTLALEGKQGYLDEAVETLTDERLEALYQAAARMVRATHTEIAERDYQRANAELEV